MSNLLYDYARESLLTARWSWLSNDIRLVLLPSTAVYNASHTLLTDITATTPAIATSTPLANKAATSGYAASDPYTFTALTSAVPVGLAVMVARVNANDELIAWLDSIRGFPFTPTGGDYSVSPGGTGNSWFRL